jgi:glycosyltransferase involved in cell wall biosynthesis
MTISVVIAAHNPDPNRFRRVLDALAAQTLPTDAWCITLVDNASSPAITIADSRLPLTVVREERLGLTWARLRGVECSDADLIIFVDDDNLLDPDYLAQTREIASSHPALGAFGGRSVAEWEAGSPPPGWMLEFRDILAIRDLGEAEIIEPPGAGAVYPRSAPIGAGMAVRRSALQPWLEAARAGTVKADREGASLTSGGDNEMVILCLMSGRSVGYFPQLRLRHVMPPGRLEQSYLGRLKYGIERSWVQLLARHGICPWKPARPATVPLRKARAYVSYAVWSGPAAWVRWRGACGHFDGRADVWRARRQAT